MPAASKSRIGISTPLTIVLDLDALDILLVSVLALLPSSYAETIRPVTVGDLYASGSISSRGVKPFTNESD